MPKLQLSFHTTFALKKEDLGKILQVAAEEQGLEGSLDVLMEKTGLGNKKVGPMRSWAMRTGLVSNNSLTPEGKVVLKKDPYLKSPITDWLMHFYLSLGDKGLQAPPSVPADWGGWTYFVYTFLPQNRVFTHNELVSHGTFAFEQETSQKLTKNFKILLRAYTEDHALAACKFLTLEGEQYTSNDNNQCLPNPFAVGYLLSKLWERDFPGKDSLLTKSLLNHPMGLALVLGITPTQMQSQLDVLETYGIIEQRKAVPPFQVFPRWENPIALLEKAYDSDR
jgi:Protein of unknown function (DUF4007)